MLAIASRQTALDRIQTAVDLNPNRSRVTLRREDARGVHDRLRTLEPAHAEALEREQTLAARLESALSEIEYLSGQLEVRAGQARAAHAAYQREAAHRQELEIAALFVDEQMRALTAPRPTLIGDLTIASVVFGAIAAEWWIYAGSTWAQALRL
jgi:hypothetical protein